MRKGIFERIQDKSLDIDGCTRWIGATSSNGKPNMYYNGKWYVVARLVKHLEEGFDLGSNLQVNHKPECKHPNDCIKNEHTYVGTHCDNMVDKVIANTHCSQGHELVGDNLYMDPRGWRGCRACRDIARNKHESAHP